MFVANFIRFPAMQKNRKSVQIWPSYREFKGGNFFSETRCRTSRFVNRRICLRLYLYLRVQKLIWIRYVGVTVWRSFCKFSPNYIRINVKTSLFKTWCKGDKGRASKTATITVFDPVMCKFNSRCRYKTSCCVFWGWGQNGRSKKLTSSMCR